VDLLLGLRSGTYYQRKGCCARAWYLTLPRLLPFVVSLYIYVPVPSVCCSYSHGLLLIIYILFGTSRLLIRACFSLLFLFFFLLTFLSRIPFSLSTTRTILFFFRSLVVLLASQAIYHVPFLNKPTLPLRRRRRRRRCCCCDCQPCQS
jgi:hypothetical protein